MRLFSPNSPELHSIPLVILIMLVMGFFAVLFLQSGIDKLIDRKGNLEWLTGHFSKSPLAGRVPVLLSIITFFELATGAFSVVTMGFTPFVNLLGFWMPFAASSAAGFTLLMLFTGQRLAKDYGGAAGIVPYFIVSIVSMLLFGVLAALNF